MTEIETLTPSLTLARRGCALDQSGGKWIDVGVAGGRLDYEVEGEHLGGLRFEKIGLGWYISGEQIAFTPMIGNGARHAQQQIAEGWRGADAARAVSAASLGSDFAATLGPIDPDARNNLRIKAHFALAPIKLRAVCIDSIEPGRLASVMTVAALFDAAGPAIAAGAEVVGRDPAATTGRLVQTEMLPSVGLLRMLKDAAELANSSDGSNKASAIVALDLSLSGLLDPKRLASPQLAPALARWMRDNRMRAVIQTCVTRLIPCIDTRQTKIAAASFDIERRDDAQPIAAIANRIVERVRHLSGLAVGDEAHASGDDRVFVFQPVNVLRFVADALDANEVIAAVVVQFVQRQFGRATFLVIMTIPKDAVVLGREIPSVCAGGDQLRASGASVILAGRLDIAVCKERAHSPLPIRASGLAGSASEGSDSSGDEIGARASDELLVTTLAALDARNRVREVFQEVRGLLLDVVVVEDEGHLRLHLGAQAAHGFREGGFGGEDWAEAGTFAASPLVYIAQADAVHGLAAGDMGDAIDFTLAQALNIFALGLYQPADHSRRTVIDANRQIPNFPLMRHYAATPVLAVGRAEGATQGSCFSNTAISSSDILRIAG